MSEGALAPFVPAIITDRLVTAGAPDAGLDAWRTSGTVLVVDITGFTALTETLARGGPGGAETLATILNASLGEIVDRILARGGDVVTFAGDAIIALWPDASAASIRRAAAAALDGLAALDAEPEVEGVRVRARAGIGLGDLWAGIVGGVGGEWRWVVGGPPVGATGHAASHAHPGQLVLTAEAASVAGVATLPVGDGSAHALLEAGTPLDVGDEPAGSADRAAAAVSDTLLGAFVPRELVRRVGAGISGWLAEFRRLSVLFVGVRGFDADAPGAQAIAQQAFRAAQEIIDRYDGSLNQIVDDDKGLTLLAGWGVPDRTHEDDAARAVLAASAIAAALSELGLRADIGITTGRAFTGIRGSATRCEYAMVGDVVNLAARLMQTSVGEVRCDAATARAVAARLDSAGLASETLGPLTLKGKAEGVEAFRIGRVAGHVGERRAPSTTTRTMVGREAEWAALRARVERLAGSGRGGVVVIEGEPGVGKSELLRHLVTNVPDPVRIHVGEADAIERSTAYYAWRSPLLDLLDVEAPARAAVEAAVLARLAGDAALVERAPLLDAILPIELPADPYLAELEADVRANAIRDLSVRLVGAAVAERPRIVVIEDVHWMDSSSWTLLLAVARRVPGVLLVLSTRPMGQEAPAEFDRVLAEPEAHRIVLGPLPPEATEALVCHALGVAALPPGVGRFIELRAEGNPFFSQQLAFALRDAGHLVVRGAELRTATGVGDLADLDIPDSVQGVLASRIDRLSPSEQLTLKVASVIGRLFRVVLLSDVHPLPDGRDTVDSDLERSAGLDLTRLEQPDPDRSYLFTHVITQQVAYDLLVFAQRRPLHRAVAEWYEAHVPDLDPLVPLLAHHWSRAGVVPKALHYLGRAGEQALQNYANAEALSFLGDAIALDDAEGRPTPPETRADWERWTAIALVKSARYREALPHFEAALTLMGAPNPGGRVRRVLSIQRHFALQGWRRIRRSRVRDEDRERALKISECHRYLSEVSYWRNDLPRMVHAMLASLNHAEPAGDSKETVFGFASVGFLFGLVQMHGIARRYRRMTDDASARVGNPDAAGYAAELSGVYHLVIADGDGARAVATRGMDIFREIGDTMRWHTCHAIVGLADLHQGRFPAATANMREALATLGPEGLLQNRVWTMSALIEVELAQDRLEPALVDELEDSLGPAVHHHDEIMARGVIAKARLRSGDPERALEQALRIPPMLDVFPPPSYHSMIGILGAVDVLIARWAADPGDAAARRDARHGLRGLRMFARFNHGARARAATFGGEAQRIEGSLVAARRSWDRARTIARKQDVPYEHGLADLALAATYPKASAERAAAVTCALADFETSGATYDAARARALIDAPAPTGDDLSPTPVGAASG